MNDYKIFVRIERMEERPRFGDWKKTDMGPKLMMIRVEGEDEDDAIERAEEGIRAILK